MTYTVHVGFKLITLTLFIWWFFSATYSCEAQSQRGGRWWRFARGDVV